MAFPATSQDYKKGVAAYRHGDFETALREMGPLALAGDARAQNALGLMFYTGHGVPRDGAQAAEWFRKAADQGYASAQCNLAVMYLKGDGVPQRYGDAIYWFREAAEKGNPRALYNLGVMHLKGDGFPQDEAKAVSLFRKAAARGHAGAKRILALLQQRHLDGVTKTSPVPASSAPASVEKEDRRPVERTETRTGRTTEAPQVAARNTAETDEGTSTPEMTEALKAVARRSAEVEEEDRLMPKNTEVTAQRPTAAVTAVVPGTYRIQLGAVRSQSVAVKEADRLNRVFASLLGEIRVAPVRADLGERGVFWRLRAGSFDDRVAAKALCGRIAERNQACIVVKK